MNLTEIKLMQSEMIKGASNISYKNILEKNKHIFTTVIYA